MRAIELELKDSWVPLVKNDLYKFAFRTIMLIFMLSLTYFLLKKKGTLLILHARKGIRTSLIAQLVKDLPAMQETWVRSLSWEDPLEKEMATHSNILAWRIPRTESLAGYSPWGHKSRT